MFSRDDSDRRFRAIDEITLSICHGAIISLAGVALVIWIAALFVCPSLFGILGAAVIASAFVWQAYRRIRRALSRPDEHETTFMDREG